MTPREVLLKAAALVERGWCQGAFAVTSNGVHTNPIDPDATCFCPLGAIRRACAPLFPQSYNDRTVHAVGTMLHTFIRASSIPAWNDAPGRTQAEVVAALKAAAEACG